MSDQIDINNISALVISNQLTEFRNELSGGLRRSWDKHFTSFASYFEKAKDRYGYTKTILYKDKAVPLQDIYVGTSLRGLSKELDETDVIDMLARGEKLLVSATAGSGKSFFAKYLFLALLASNIKIPLLIELRNLNGTQYSILEQINNELRSAAINVPMDVLEYWIDTGEFCLILDGYDEVSRERITDINAEIKELASKYSSLPIVITSRPSEELEYLSELEILRVQSLNRSQAVALVQRLDYDLQVKERFLDHLEKDLFDRHRDFLSNPLLLTIMLMTYGEIAEIPSKMHVFYDQAFDVLFYRHDASKGMYRREIRCGLALDDFKSVLSAVAASGYIRSKASHSNTELIEYIRKAKKTVGIKQLSPEKYKEDLLQSVCILVNDGKYLTYNHRSFQEYFAALFMVNMPLKEKRKLYDIYMARGGWDNAIYLAFEMNRSVLEYEYIYPVLDENRGVLEMSELDVLRSWVDRLSLTWVGGPGKNGRPYFGIEGGTEFFHLVCFVERAYRMIAGEHRLKLGHVLTKKAFKENIGISEPPLEISLDAISSEEIELLRRLGLFAHIRKRIKFLLWLLGYLERQQDVTGSADVEDWL